MASLVNENCHEFLQNNFSDHNISNNGQHVYNHCHGRMEHVQHDKLYIEHEFTSFNVHEKQSRRNIERNKYYSTIETEDNNIAKYKESTNILKSEADETQGNYVETTDDIEIIFFVQKGEDDLMIEVVSNTFLPTENQTILASSSIIQDNTNDKIAEDIKVNIADNTKVIIADSNEDKITDGTNVDHNSKKVEYDNDKAIKNKDVANKENDKFTPKKSTNWSKAKHVHFQEQSVHTKHVNLRSHKMEKEVVKKQEFPAVEISNKNNVSYGQVSNKNDFNNTTVSNTSNNGTKVETQSKTKFKSTQKTSSHVSSSDSDLRKHAVGRLIRKDNLGNQLPQEKKTISILRRDDVVKADAIEYGESKENQKHNFTYQNKQNTCRQVKQNDNDSTKLKKSIQGSASHTCTSTSTDNKARTALRSKSTIDAADVKLVDEKREKEKLRKKLSRKKQRRNKHKTPKTELEIYQKQIETGQLRSMFSRYKTEGLKCLELQELLHKGTFCSKYKANFKNKKVVLSVYDSETAELINALDMAHMGSSYFVLGRDIITYLDDRSHTSQGNWVDLYGGGENIKFTDCMTGPYGKLWFMSIFHSFGDLTQLLSRDQSRHVIGEVHAQFITAGVLIGVDFLHQNSIVHGNIKPSKVLINALGYPVLTGFVKMSDEVDIEGSEAYTPAYAAPEHLRGNREPPIDIFSVGCMAYEIITGVLPFDGETRGKTEENIQKACRPVYDPELFSFAGEFFIDSCLRKNSRERFWIGVERSNLIYEEWFSTLDWRDLRRQTIRSPVLNALQLIDNRASLTWEEKTVQYKWGQVMDVMCPYTPCLQVDEGIFY